MINSFHFTPKIKNEEVREESIMLRGALSGSFNPEQWKQISSLAPQDFHKQQESIFHSLMLCLEKFHQYFSLFYSNHTQLHYWSLLAREQHYEMEKYVFKKLLNKTVQQYVEQFKQVQAIKQKQKGRNRKLMGEKSHHKESLDELSQKIFRLLVKKQSSVSLKSKKNAKDQKNSPEKKSKSILTSAKNSACLTPQEKVSKNRMNMLKKQDFHDLYMKTFHACEGSRYIFYNHERHMKGLNQMSFYNNFIRNKSRKGRSKDLTILDLHKKQSNEQNQQQQRFATEYEGMNARKQQKRALLVYQYSTVDDINQRATTTKKHEKRKQLKSQVIFRRFKKHNIGKFIRK